MTSSSPFAATLTGYVQRSCDTACPVLLGLTTALCSVRLPQLVNAGGFGVPTLLIRKAGDAEEAMVFGSDRMNIVAQLLGQQWTEPLHQHREEAVGSGNHDRHSRL